MFEKSSVQEVLDGIRADLAESMSLATTVGVNDFVFQRTVDGKTLYLRIKKDGNHIGFLLGEDLNTVVTSAIQAACFFPFQIVGEEQVVSTTTFMPDREFLLISISKKMAADRYSLELDFRLAKLSILHFNHLAPTGASPCFNCSNTPFMTCGA